MYSPEKRTCTLHTTFERHERCPIPQIISEYDQETPQSQPADKPMES